MEGAEFEVPLTKRVTNLPLWAFSSVVGYHLTSDEMSSKAVEWLKW
jgi:hypothetical protein